MRIVFAQQENFFDAIYLSLYYDGKQVFLNKNKSPNVSVDYEAPSLDIQGNYIVEFYKENNELITSLNTDLKIGENDIFLPLVLNAKYLIFKDSKGNPLGKIDIQEVRLCNEDKKCEPIEGYFCPLDCKSANNPYYPFSQKLELKPTAIQTTTYPLPSEVFNKIFLYSIFGLAVIFIIILIIYLLIKRR